MSRCKCCIILALLLLHPEFTNMENVTENSEENKSVALFVNPLPNMILTETSFNLTSPETEKELVCFYCPEKMSKSPQCLDTSLLTIGDIVTCLGNDVFCFTTVIVHHNFVKNVVRGCHRFCNQTEHTKCCDWHFCNSELITLYPQSNRRNLFKWSLRFVDYYNKTNKVQPNVMFFVTVLLILQTVVKVVMI